jgi:hypothetical protein
LGNLPGSSKYYLAEDLTNMAARALKIPNETMVKIRRLKKEGLSKWALMDRFNPSIYELQWILRKKEKGKKHAG